MCNIPLYKTAAREQQKQQMILSLPHTFLLLCVLCLSIITELCLSRFIKSVHPKEVSIGNSTPSRIMVTLVGTVLTQFLTVVAAG